MLMRDRKDTGSKVARKLARAEGLETAVRCGSAAKGSGRIYGTCVITSPSLLLLVSSLPLALAPLQDRVD